MAGRNVPVFRNVYSCDALKREDAYQKLVATGQHLERHGFGVLKVRPGAWPVFVKHRWGSMSSQARSTASQWAIPLHFFHGFLEESVMALAIRKRIPAPRGGFQNHTQQLGGAAGPEAAARLVAAQTPALPGKPDVVGKPSEGCQRSRQSDQASQENAAKGTYKEVSRGALEEEEIPRTIPAATRVARRLCLKTKPACGVSFTTKRLMNEAGQSVYKLWRACAE